MTARFWWDTNDELGLDYTLVVVDHPDVIQMYLDEVALGERVWTYLHSNVGTLEEQLEEGAPERRW